jgi:hypothetical protein
MDSYRPSVSPESRAFAAAILGEPDPDEVAAFARRLLGEPDPYDCETFLEAILGEGSGHAALRPHSPPGAHAWGGLTTGGLTDDRLFTIGVEEARRESDKWKSSQTWDTTKNAKILRKSMERDHSYFGPGEEPHHIVQGTDPRAADGRALLDRYHIDLNGAENGIKLTRQIHQTRGLQRRKAIEAVTARLRRAAGAAKTWEAARDSIMIELGRIRRDIKAGRFPCP